MKTDSAGDFNFIEPTIEKLAEGVWQFGGYGLAPMSIIETEDGLIAFDTGDTKHNSELMLEAFRTVTDKPINLQAYGEVSSYPPAIFYQTAGWYDNDAEKPKNLTPIDEARRLVPLLGGPDKVLEAARAAMNANEFAWTAKPANQLSLLNNLPNQARFAR